MDRPPGWRGARSRTVPQSTAILLLALLALVPYLVPDVASSDPRLSVIATVDEEGQTPENPQPGQQTLPHPAVTESADCRPRLRHAACAEGATPSPARSSEAAALGVGVTRSPPTL